mgnify:CR=1 FL=1
MATTRETDGRGVEDCRSWGANRGQVGSEGGVVNTSIVDRRRGEKQGVPQFGRSEVIKVE